MVGIDSVLDLYRIEGWCKVVVGTALIAVGIRIAAVLVGSIATVGEWVAAVGHIPLMVVEDTAVEAILVD